MGNRLVKPPPGDRPIAPPRGRNNPGARPFPVLTPQSYVPGGGGGGGPGLGGLYTGVGGNPFPMLNPSSYLPPSGTLEPPIMNYSNGSMISPAPPSFPSMFPPSMPPAYPMPPPMPYPNQNALSIMGPPPGPAYDPGFQSMSRRRPTRICRPRRSRRCRPVIHVIDSSSCSTVSSCRSASPCSRRRRRSRSYSRRCAPTPQPQQPIILLPIQCQQPASALSAPVSNQLIQQQQQQPQQIILPPIQIQQPGQYQQQQQQFGLPPMQIQQLGGQLQQQALTLPQIQLNGSTIMPNTSSNPIIISNGQQLVQSSSSLPQLQPGSIQYVQTMPQTSSPLQYVTAGGRSTAAPARVLVNSTNKKRSTAVKPLQRSISARQVSQLDLKYGRSPFDWYKNKQKDNIINDNVQVAQR